MHNNDQLWRRLPASALGGGVVWLALVGSRLGGLTRLTLIDLLFLLAPLVIAPLGLALIDFDEGLPSSLLLVATRVQPLGAVLAVLAFLLPIGIPAAAVASGWLLVGAVAALGALAYLIQGRSLHPRAHRDQHLHARQRLSPGVIRQADDPHERRPCVLRQRRSLGRLRAARLRRSETQSQPLSAGVANC